MVDMKTDNLSGKILYYMRNLTDRRILRLIFSEHITEHNGESKIKLLHSILFLY